MLSRAEVVVVGVGAFVGFELSFNIVVVGGDFGGEFGFFQCIINNLVGITHPAALGFVSL